MVGVFRCVRETFKKYRQKVFALASHYSTPKCWDFPSALVFTRFDGFLARVLQLKVSSTSFEVIIYTFSHNSVFCYASNNNICIKIFVRKMIMFSRPFSPLFWSSKGWRSWFLEVSEEGFTPSRSLEYMQSFFSFAKP